MKLDPWKRLQIRFMWAVLSSLIRIHKSMGIQTIALLPDVSEIEIELRELKDQE